MIDKSQIKIAVVSTYPPRECGIATFSKSLINTFNDLYISDPVKIIAVSDEKGAYNYDNSVVYEIDQYNAKAYVRAAEFINNSNFEVVSLQHEYGIFGGENGDYIIKFLESVNKPVVTSLHSILKEHNEHRRNVTQRILDLSDSVVVMTKISRRILLDNFNIDSKKVRIVEHGVPNVRFDQKEETKKRLGFAGKQVLMTFGLINRGKGIEHAIEAVSRVAGRFPDIVYLIAGITHPDVVKQEGESYRRNLESRVRQLGLQNNVKFLNRYFEYDKLVDHLLATDIYIAPQLDKQQSFSGTIAYAMGTGDAIISSPTNYAIEVLRGRRGAIVEPDAKLIAAELERLLASLQVCQKMQLKAYQYARRMIWPQTGAKYLNILESHLFTKNEKWLQRLPNFNHRPSLAYLKRMTDDFGLVQHAKFSTPDSYFGYSLDDQARALIIVAKYLETYGSDKSVSSLVHKYVQYLDVAIDDGGVIHNFIDKEGKYADKIASNDSISRSFWSLAYVATSPILPLELKNKAFDLVIRYQKRIRNTFLKPLAYNLIGYSFLKEDKQVSRLGDTLVDRFEQNTDERWQWFEEELTWGSAIVPYSLIKAYEQVKKPEYLSTVLKSIEFLERVCRYKEVPAPIGQDGWYFRYGRRALYDQQPIEAADMVLLYNELYYATREERYRQKAAEWMGWFYGNNIHQMILYDCITRGVCDGLTRRGINLNQGAESIVVYLLAYFSFAAPDHKKLKSKSLAANQVGLKIKRSPIESV